MSKWLAWSPNLSESAETEGHRNPNNDFCDFCDFDSRPFSEDREAEVEVDESPQVGANSTPGSILASLPPDTAGVPWPEWVARESNRRWLEEGVTGQPGRLTPETVAHGLAAFSRSRETVH